MNLNIFFENKIIIIIVAAAAGQKRRRRRHNKRRRDASVWRQMGRLFFIYSPPFCYSSSYKETPIISIHNISTVY